MRAKKQLKKKDMDSELLEKMKQFRSQWNRIDEMLQNSVEPSERSLYDLSVKKAKYFFLLKEARSRHLKGTI